MTKAKYKASIVSQCQAVGTYKPSFDPVIDALASTLEQRDRVYRQYKKEGSQPTIVYTNKNGASNPIKNPLLTLWDDLNKSALAYFRDMGLTPAGLKKLNDKALKAEKKKTSLSDVLNGL